jgi:hypothetical protein
LTNLTFSVEACSTPAYPALILLTNGVPFVVSATNSPFAAPPGPPQQLFFYVIVTNAVPGILFELYNLSGDADLVLQQAVPPTMPPYFDASSFPGAAPQQIVLRTNTPELPASSQVADLRGEWYLGVYNNDPVNVAYTIRAVLPGDNSLLSSAQPLRLALKPGGAPDGPLLSWNSVIGERYIVQYTASIAAPVTWTNLASIIATTPLTTFAVLPAPTPPAYFRVIQVSNFLPALAIKLLSGNQVSVSWSTAFPGFTLQSKSGLSGAWSNVALSQPAGILAVGNQFVVYQTVGTTPRFYRLIK